MQIEQRRLDEIFPYENNPRLNDSAVESVCRSIREFGWRQPIVVDSEGVIIVGHTRWKAAKSLGLDTVPVHVAENLTPAQVRAYRLEDNKSSELSEWDFAKLKIELDVLAADEFDFGLLSFDPDDLDKAGHGEPEPPETPPVEPHDDYEPVTQAGELIELGAHRLLCGDSTKAEDVERLMGGERVQLLHADPPYGMGKEKDGIENDNLYRENLDAFQMAWWKAFRPRIEDNGSAYIWGNAEDLWRLWYCGGLKDSERLTFRNEILWRDPSGVSWGKDGMKSLRMFAPDGERCLFFMLGEQGFNNNADNYWEGWEGVRSALAADCEKMAWGPEDIKRICGVGMHGHWFTKSQWTFIPEEHYKKLQAAAREHDAFKREHDELKREFYSTRAYFDNAHDNMTDVWNFPRVTGEERQGHATPKPVPMIERAIKSSTPDSGTVADPFLGSGTTLIAAENLNRKCYGIEISRKYCDVIVCRYLKHVGPDKHPELAEKYERLLNGGE
jgi:DNA modification methylase